MTHFNEGASMASKFLMLSSKTVRIDSKYRVAHLVADKLKASLQYGPQEPGITLPRWI